MNSSPRLLRWHDSEEINDPTSSRISIGHWAQNGIATRGFLIDYVSYAQKRGIAIDGIGGQKVTLDDVHDIARECRIEFRPGDVFFLRCGFTMIWEAMSMEQKLQYRTDTAEKNHKHSGIEQSERVVHSLWENHIVAVAGDEVGFEVRPNQDQQCDLHHILLAG
jgi:hypothetical protein